MKNLPAIIIIGILCLSIFSAFAPRAMAETDVTLSVNPQKVELWTPSFGETFAVNITLTNVTGLYGYEFKLYWNTTCLDATGMTVTPPTEWGTNYAIGMNETNEALGRVWLAVSLLPSATTFSGNVSLATLTFKVTQDPIYPENTTSALHFADTYLSDENVEPIDHDTVDGEYCLYSTKPTIAVEPPTDITSKKAEAFNVNVTVSDVVNLYSYELSLSYDASLLDITTVQVGNFLKPPYYVYKFSINHTSGNITLGVASQSALVPAPPANGSGLLATITFTTIPIVWPDPAQNTSLHLYDTILKTDLEVTIPHSTADGFYEYTPIPGDINSDGVVDLVDLRLVAMAYGSTPSDTHWDSRADLKRDGLINIFDLVLVSKNYGRADP